MPNALGQIHRIEIVAQAGQDVSVACPACGCENAYRVLRAGNAIIACRECKSPLLLRIQNNSAITPSAPQPAPQLAPQPVSQPAPQPAQAAFSAPQPVQPPVQVGAQAMPSAPLLGLAIAAGDGSFMINEHAQLGQPVRIKCGNCGKMHILKPASAGRKTISCVACKTPIVFVVDDPAAQPQVKVATAKAPAEPQVTIALRDHDKQQSMGGIAFGGFMGLNKKTIRLRVGQNTIGRADSEKPSSISFNDSFMSRQSVMIDVLPADDAKAGYRFLFRVLSAANPVYVNKQQYAVGDSVYLNYGDTIRLGRTTMRFVRVK